MAPQGNPAERAGRAAKTVRRRKRDRERVVGLAGDLRGLADNPRPPLIVYQPLAQRPSFIMTFYVRRGDADEEVGVVLRVFLGGAKDIRAYDVDLDLEAAASQVGLNDGLHRV